MVILVVYKEEFSATQHIVQELVSSHCLPRESFSQLNESHVRVTIWDSLQADTDVVLVNHELWRDWL